MVIGILADVRILLALLVLVALAAVLAVAPGESGWVQPQDGNALYPANDCGQNFFLYTVLPDEDCLRGVRSQKNILQHVRDLEQRRAAYDPDRQWNTSALDMVLEFFAKQILGR